VITIGNQFGGPELKGALIQMTLNKAAKIAIVLREKNYNDGAEAWINPIFIVPGSVLNPDFQRQKLGHFSRKQKGLVVMIAVPPTVANGDGIIEFILAELRAEKLIAEIGERLASDTI
jgi:hypothetical protein